MLSFFYLFYFTVANGSACDATNGGCSDICVNRTGQITCYCNDGYNLTAGGKKCQGNVITANYLLHAQV